MMDTAADIHWVMQAGPARVAYRDSKLTRVLQPCLAGTGRTAVLVCINPSAGVPALRGRHPTTTTTCTTDALRCGMRADHAEAARSALRFADTAKQVTQAPTVNLVLPALMQIRQLRAENATLHAELVRGHSGGRCPASACSHLCQTHVTCC